MSIDIRNLRLVVRVEDAQDSQVSPASDQAAQLDKLSEQLAEQCIREVMARLKEGEER